MFDGRLLTQAFYTAVDREPDCIAEAEARLAAYARTERVRRGGSGPGIRFASAGRPAHRRGSSSLPMRSSSWPRRGACIRSDRRPCLSRPGRSRIGSLASLSRDPVREGFSTSPSTLTAPRSSSRPSTPSLTKKSRGSTTRTWTARGSPGSRTGRRLLAYLSRLKVPILAAGSSDWVVLSRAPRVHGRRILFPPLHSGHGRRGACGEGGGQDDGRGVGGGAPSDGGGGAADPDSPPARCPRASLSVLLVCCGASFCGMDGRMSEIAICGALLRT